MDRNCKMNHVNCLLKGNQPQNVRIHFEIKPEDNVVHLGVDTMRLIDEESTCGSKRQLEQKKIRFQGLSTKFQQDEPPLSPAGEAVREKNHEKAIHTALVAITQGIETPSGVKAKEMNKRSKPLSRKQSGPQSDKIRIQMKSNTKITSIVKKVSVVALPRHNSKKTPVKITSKKSIMLAKRQVEISSPRRRRKEKSIKKTMQILSDKHSKIKIEQDENFAIKKETVEIQKSTYLVERKENHNLRSMVEMERSNENELQNTAKKIRSAPQYKSLRRRASVTHEIARHDNVSDVVGRKGKGRADFAGSRAAIKIEEEGKLAETKSLDFETSTLARAPRRTPLQNDEKHKKKVGSSKRKSRGTSVTARESEKLSVIGGENVAADFRKKDNFNSAARDEIKNITKVSDANSHGKPKNTETSQQYQAFLDDSNLEQSGTDKVMSQTSAVTSPNHVISGGHSTAKDDVLKKDTEVKVNGVHSNKSSARESNLKIGKFESDFESKNSLTVETAKDDGLNKVSKEEKKLKHGMKKSSSIDINSEAINTASIVVKPSEIIANDEEMKSIYESKNLVAPPAATPTHWTADLTEHKSETSATFISPPNEIVEELSNLRKISSSALTHDRTSFTSSPSQSTKGKEIKKSHALGSDNEANKSNISPPNKKLKMSLSLTPADSKPKKSFKLRKSLTSAAGNEERKSILIHDNEMKKVAPAETLTHLTANIGNNSETSATSYSVPSKIVDELSILRKKSSSSLTHDRTSFSSSPSQTMTDKEVKKPRISESDNEVNLSTPNKKIKMSLTPDSNLKKLIHQRKSLTSAPDKERGKNILILDNETEKVATATTLTQLSADIENNSENSASSISAQSSEIVDELSILRKISSSVSTHDSTSFSSSPSQLTPDKETNKSPVLASDNEPNESTISTPNKKTRKSLNTTPDSKIKKSYIPRDSLTSASNEVMQSVLTQDSELKTCLISNPDRKVSCNAIIGNEMNKSSISTPASVLNISNRDTEVAPSLLISEQRKIYEISRTQHKLSDVSEENEILQHKNIASSSLTRRETDSKSQTKYPNISDTNALINAAAVVTPSNEIVQLAQSSEKRTSESEIADYSEHSDYSSSRIDSKVVSIDTPDVAKEILSTKFYEEKQLEISEKTNKDSLLNIEQRRESQVKLDTSDKTSLIESTEPRELTVNTRDETSKMNSTVSSVILSPCSAPLSASLEKYKDEITSIPCSRVTDESELQLGEGKENYTEMPTMMEEKQDEAVKQRPNDEFLGNDMEIHTEEYDGSREKLEKLDKNIMQKEIGDNTAMQSPVADKKVEEIMRHTEVKGTEAKTGGFLKESQQIYVGDIKENKLEIEKKDTEIMSAPVLETEELSNEKNVMEMQSEIVSSQQDIIEIQKIKTENVEVTNTQQELVEIQTHGRPENVASSQQDVFETLKVGPENLEEVTTTQQDVQRAMQTRDRPKIIETQVTHDQLSHVRHENEEKDTEVTCSRQESIETQKIETENVEEVATSQQVEKTHGGPENVNLETEVASSQQNVFETLKVRLENVEKETEIIPSQQDVVENLKIGPENVDEVTTTQQGAMQSQTNVGLVKNETEFMSIEQEEREVSETAEIDARREMCVKSWPRRALCTCVYLMSTLWLTLLLLGLLGYHYVEICALYQAQIVQWALLMLHLAYRLGLETAEEQPNLIRIVTLEIFWFLLGIYVATLVAMNEIVLAPMYYVYAFFVR